MVDKKIIQKSINTAILKCSKPKSSSNYNTSLPMDIEDINLDDFIEDSYSNHLMDEQIKLQEEKVSFSDAELSDLTSYFGYNFKFINGLIYESKKFLKEWGGGSIEKMWRKKLPSVKRNLDSAIAKSIPLQQNTRLYRRGKFDITLDVGDTGVWEGYTSTSYSSSGTTSIGGGDWDIEIFALKGVKGINANANTKRYSDLYKSEITKPLTNHTNEEELLLGRNTKYTVLSVDEKNHEASVVVF